MNKLILIPICVGCKKTPSEIEEYVEMAKEEKITPDRYVMESEGTYNRLNGHFMCTDCYIEAGMPSLPAPAKWIAP